MKSMVGAVPSCRAKDAARRLLMGLSLAALVVAVGTLALPATAFAQSLFPSPRPDPDGEYGEGLRPFEADGPLIAVVSTGSQHIRVFDRNGMIAAAKVSTGRKGNETPEGVFSILERKVEHNSNLYDDASMPFMQRITWSGVALHEGVVPGYRASHGCIRLPSGFAERLFRTTRMATRVVIVPHDGIPLPMSHPVLFQPGLPPAVPEAIPAAQPTEAQPAPAAQAPETGPDSAGEPPMMLGATLPQSPAPSAPATPETPAAAPPAPAPTGAELKARRKAAEDRLAAATQAISDGRVGVRSRLVEQGHAEKALRQATVLANRAEGRAQSLAAAFTAARSEPDETTAVAEHIEAMIELAQLRGREDTAREVAAEKAAAARVVLDQVKKLESERQSAQNEIRSIARRLSPVTIFVSRQTGRVYVRQSFREIMDVPVTIRDPDRQLGTHVFTALDADGSSDTVKWVALTIDADWSEPAEAEQTRKSRKGEARKPEAPAAKRDPLAAARLALDRVEIPQAVLARVMPALQPGSTLIVSDLGPSIETGPNTDIVVQTKGEEQARQSIANFLAKKKAEAAYYSPSARRRDSGWGPPGNYWYRW